MMFAVALTALALAGTAASVPVSGGTPAQRAIISHVLAEADPGVVTSARIDGRHYLVLAGPAARAPYVRFWHAAWEAELVAEAATDTLAVRNEPLAGYRVPSGQIVAYSRAVAGARPRRCGAAAVPRGGPRPRARRRAGRARRTRGAHRRRRPRRGRPPARRSAARGRPDDRADRAPGCNRAAALPCGQGTRRHRDRLRRHVPRTAAAGATAATPGRGPCPAASPGGCGARPPTSSCG